MSNFCFETLERDDKGQIVVPRDESIDKMVATIFEGMGERTFCISDTCTEGYLCKAFQDYQGDKSSMLSYKWCPNTEEGLMKTFEKTNLDCYIRERLVVQAYKAHPRLNFAFVTAGYTTQEEWDAVDPEDIDESDEDINKPYVAMSFYVQLDSYGIENTVYAKVDLSLPFEERIKKVVKDLVFEIYEFFVTEAWEKEKVVSEKKDD